MDEVVSCPRCSRKLKLKSEHLGRAVTCPACQHQFDASRADAGWARPAEPDPDQPPRRDERPARAVGDEIDLDEVHQPRVSSEARANKELERWQQEMPETKSAYRPSGKMPPQALAFLGVGAVLGAVAGPATAVAVAGATALLAWLFLLMNDLMGDFCGRVLVIIYIIAFLVAVAGYAVGVFATAFVAATCTTWAGKLAKNRSPSAAGLMSAVSAVLCLAVLGGAAYLVIESYPQQVKFLLEPGSWWRTGVIGGSGLAAVVIVVCAAVIGSDQVEGAKFCEECEAFMEVKPLPGLPLGRLQAVVRAVGENDLSAAAELASGSKGQDGEAELYRCGGCGVGYIEFHAHFKAEWKGSENDESKAKKWLVASAGLTADEVDQFRPRRR